jgi:hypothetical protein
LGAIFNSPGTLRLIALLNNTYTRATFTNLQNQGNQQASLTNAAIDTPTLVQMAAFNFTDNDPNVNRRWLNWLKYLDGQMQTYLGTTQSCGMWVRNIIAQGLNDPSCSGVEFFAVPGPAFQVTVPAPQVPDSEHNFTKHTLIVTVQTLTVDQLGIGHGRY